MASPFVDRMVCQIPFPGHDYNSNSFYTIDTVSLSHAIVLKHSRRARKVLDALQNSIAGTSLYGVFVEQIDGNAIAEKGGRYGFPELEMNLRYRALDTPENISNQFAGS
jgi:hypothetical protein